MGLPSKVVTASNIFLKDKNEVVFNVPKYCSIFKNYFPTLAQNLVSKLPLSPTAPKMKFSIKDFFSKCDQIRTKLRIWSHLLKKSLMETLFFV